ncbi:hypothetical protein DICA3_A06898 [Diutina catenulata]
MDPISNPPSQMDVMQRRPSLSSLSSASGYTSSGYGGGGAPGGHSNSATPQLSTARLTQRAPPAWMASGNTNVWVEQQSGALPPTETEIDDDDDDDELDDDELIPTAIVIKNIPFAIKKEQLLDVMTKLSLPLPYAFNYHFDNGVFRGLAFANFTSTDETSMVVNQLNGREIGGRKLRVEYKKMLPLQERERIEREKREKRGQLEEQHRSTSNASLASLLSQASTTAATKNLSVAGGAPGNPQTTERVYVTLPLAHTSAGPLPNDINMNDADTLELYTQLAVYRDDSSKAIFELAIAAPSLSMAQRKVLTGLCQYLGLLELFDNGYIVVRRKPGHVVQSLATQLPAAALAPASGSASGSAHGPSPSTPSHSSSMMNLNQLNIAPAPPHHAPAPHPELLRSHSQSALPLPRAAHGLRNQSSTPVPPPHFPQYQQPAPQPMGRGYAQAPNLSSRSAAARSYVDMRGTPPLADTPTQGYHPQVSQPGTPLAHNDIGSRFQPFSHQMNGSLTNLQQQGGPQDSYDLLGNKFGGLNLASNFDSNSGIWGPK